MTPEQLREEVRSAAMKFTQDVAAIFAEAFTSAAEAYVQEQPQTTPVKKAAPAPSPKPKPKQTRAPRAASGKRVRRSAKELNQAADRVYSFLKAQKEPMRIEAINDQLGTTTKELMRPIHKLLKENKIVKSGERRATKYAVKLDA